VLALPALPSPVIRANMLIGGARVHVAQSDAGVTLTLPVCCGTEVPPPIDRVVVLQVARRR